MQQIDFLPPQYRKQQARRQWLSQQIVVVLAFCALIGGLWVSQFYVRRSLNAELAALGPPYNQAVQQNAKLAELQTRLQDLRVTAELYTYLRHPWPRTQLLEAILTPLPQSIVFQEVKIVREAARDADRLNRAAQAKAAAPPVKLAPAASDLRQLRQRFDPSRVLVHITGITSDSAELHRYLGILGRHRLFTSAELINSGTAGGDDTGKLLFSAVLTVRAGYGQPGGPTDPKPPQVTQSSTHP